MYKFDTNADAKLDILIQSSFHMIAALIKFVLIVWHTFQQVCQAFESLHTFTDS